MGKKEEVIVKYLRFIYFTPSSSSSSCDHRCVNNVVNVVQSSVYMPRLNAYSQTHAHLIIPTAFYACFKIKTHILQMRAIVFS